MYQNCNFLEGFVLLVFFAKKWLHTIFFKVCFILLNLTIIILY